MSSKKNILIYLLLMGFLTISGCKKSENANSCNNVTADKIVFFSLKNYFCDVIKTYESKQYKVNKRVMFGEQSELIEGMEIDWSKEFQTFIVADINHTAWVDKFTIDTLKMEDKYVVTYQSNTVSIPVKFLEIEFANDAQPIKITIKTGRGNMLYKSKQTITFEPDKYYKVEGFQKTLMLRKSEFVVDGVIVKP